MGCLGCFPLVMILAAWRTAKALDDDGANVLLALALEAEHRESTEHRDSSILRGLLDPLDFNIDDYSSDNLPVNLYSSKHTPVRQLDASQTGCTSVQSSSWCGTQGCGKGCTEAATCTVCYCAGGYYSGGGQVLSSSSCTACDVYINKYKYLFLANTKHPRPTGSGR